ncbi:MAG: hypothetical protein AAB769_00010 [Patescibacteria group bacterium]
MQPDKIHWSALEYEHRDRSNDWFWVVGIIALALAVISIIYDNILFAILIVIGTFTLLMYAARAPHMVDFEINRRGVIIKDRLYPYNALKSFWLRDNHRGRKLVIQSEKMLMPNITIPLSDDMDINTIHLFLVEYLEEQEHHESLSELIMDYLGF